MSSMYSQVYGANKFFTISLKGYPNESLQEEISFLAYYFHWSHREITELSHRERLFYCNEISKINKKLNGEHKKNIFDV